MDISYALVVQIAQLVLGTAGAEGNSPSASAWPHRVVAAHEPGKYIPPLGPANQSQVLMLVIFRHCAPVDLVVPDGGMLAWSYLP
jgi:hypothetical protein